MTFLSLSLLSTNLIAYYSREEITCGTYAQFCINEIYEHLCNVLKDFATD